jgi:predicted tellurium resistance membrane protein TerC
MAWVTNPESWIAFLTLLSLEIVLGVDNIIFISILSGRLPPHQQKKARLIGLLLAIVTRVGMLFSISIIVDLKDPLFHVLKKGISGRDLILLAGGLFLLFKATREIHHKLEGEEEDDGTGKKKQSSMASVIAQILVLDTVFSLDSVITAVGMVDELPIMISAVIVATLVMIAAAGSIGRFVDRHPTVKMLALSFLLLIGLTLLAEGLHFHIPKGYVYFAMGFSIAVELLNMRLRKKKKVPPVKLREPYAKERESLTG